MYLIYIVLLALVSMWPSRAAAQCTPTVGPPANGTLIETFEKPGGTDNQWEVWVGAGNSLDPNYVWPYAPPSWGTKSGKIQISSKGVLWRRKDTVPSPNGYFFTGSFAILSDGLTDGTQITIFVSKTIDETGSNAPWRLYFAKQGGVLFLKLILGWDSSTNNASALAYTFPLTVGQVYDTAILYDTKRRVYLWSVNGQLAATGSMPCDWPLIGTKVIGSSGSVNGLNSVYVVDNVRWFELPQ